VSNPYAPPIHSGGDEQRPPSADGRSAQLFRVSPSTLAILYFVTLGTYGLYWFYKHWAVQKRVRGLDISPLARGFFTIFFAHRLFKIIDQTARATGASPRWNSQSQATMYVSLMIAGRVIMRLGSDATAALVTGLVVGAASVLPLLEAQRVANQANGQSLAADTWID
jgi:hypothetical protein